MIQNAIQKVKELKEKLNAVILAHYYQESEIQDLADFVGDSLALAQKAAQVECDVIVFAGVHFMAETAKILNPDKVVLMPDEKAGCSLAESCPPEDFSRFVNQHPDHIVVTYINCSAEIKTLSDIVCTSTNAEKIINSIPPTKPILFAPDEHLGRYLIKKTGRDMLLWKGRCVVHDTFSLREIIRLKTRNPEALVIAHPECPESILNIADHIGSTSSLLKFTRESSAKKFIVATESGIIHQMKKMNPDKEYIPAPSDSGCSCNECPYMKLNTLEKLISCMEKLEPQITLSKDIIEKASRPINAMLRIS